MITVTARPLLGGYALIKFITVSNVIIKLRDYKFVVRQIVKI